MEINLAELLCENSDERSRSCIYRLHAVFTHQGDVDRGCGSVYIKQDREARWLLFDGGHVFPVADHNVLDDNFGGQKFASTLNQRNQARVAYVLVYIRDLAIDEVLAPVKDAIIPPHLSRCSLSGISNQVLNVILERRIEEDRKRDDVKRAQEEGEHLYMSVKVLKNVICSGGMFDVFLRRL